MFRFLPITLLLIVSLASVGYTGFDNEEIISRAIAVYNFEDTTDFTARESDGELKDGATLADDGVSGKGLQLTSEASFSSSTLDPFPILASLEFSIIAQVKMSQEEDVSVHFSLSSYDKDTFFPTSNIVLCITPDGNLKGESGELTAKLEIITMASIESEESNLADNEWHHIAFTKYGDTYALFIDGESVKSYHSSQYRRLAGNVSSVRAFSSEPGLQGNVFVDNLAFFETGFSPYEIKGLYEDGLDKFLEIMPVSPQGRLATTWGQLKSNL